MSAAGKVVFVGAGSMGWQLCRRIVGSGADVLLHDMDTALVHRCVAEGQAEGGGLQGSLAAATSAGAPSLAEAARDADFVVTCLPNSNIVAAVKREIGAALPGGAVWVDATSGDPSQSKELASCLAAQETNPVAFLDVAVSGGPAGAANGKLTAMVGGGEEAFERAEPMIGSFASTIVHLGPAGSGHAVKAINNTLMAANIWTATEGLLALVKHGVDPTKAAAAISASSGRSWATQQRIPDHVLPRCVRAAVVRSAKRGSAKRGAGGVVWSVARGTCG